MTAPEPWWLEPLRELNGAFVFVGLPVLAAWWWERRTRGDAETPQEHDEPTERAA